MAPMERDGEVAVGDVDPGVAGVGGLPDAAAGGAHVESVRAPRARR